MIWILLLLAVVGLVWFMLQPRRLQTVESIPAVVDEKFNAQNIVETTEDPREVRPIALAAAERAGDRPVKGHGDSLTRDWPSDQAEPHATGKGSNEGPANPQ